MKKKKLKKTGKMVKNKNKNMLNKWLQVKLRTCLIVEVLNKYGIYKSIIRTLLEHAVPALQNINMYISPTIRRCAEKSHEYHISYASLSTEQALAVAICTDYIEKLKCLEHPLAFLLPRKEPIVPNYNLRSRSNFRRFL